MLARAMAWTAYPGIYDACALEGPAVREDGAGLSVTRVSALEKEM
ncbi:MAG: hypothetical protein V3S25_04870 [Nitrospirales bacterium]